MSQSRENCAEQAGTGALGSPLGQLEEGAELASTFSVSSPVPIVSGFLTFALRPACRAALEKSNPIFKNEILTVELKHVPGLPNVTD